MDGKKKYRCFLSNNGDLRRVWAVYDGVNVKIIRRQTIKSDADGEREIKFLFHILKKELGIVITWHKHHISGAEYLSIRESYDFSLFRNKDDLFDLSKVSGDGSKYVILNDVTSGLFILIEKGKNFKDQEKEFRSWGLGHRQILTTLMELLTKKGVDTTYLGRTFGKFYYQPVEEDFLTNITELSNGDKIELA